MDLLPKNLEKEGRRMQGQIDKRTCIAKAESLRETGRVIWR